MEVDLSQVLAGQHVGVRQRSERAWLVSVTHCVLPCRFAPAQSCELSMSIVSLDVSPGGHAMPI